jgi:hypothetical protein
MPNPGMAALIVLVVSGLGYLIYRWADKGLLTLDLLKMFFGFILLMDIAAICIVVLREADALTPKAGEIFSQMLTILSVLAGAFSQWAFSKSPPESKPGAPPSEK